MGELARAKLTVDEFYRWIGTQDDARFELVDGEPVMPAGATRRHDRIARNVLVILSDHLRGPRTAPRGLRVMRRD
jgi:Uma2 family endonuclease